jgi:hypothetical protein
LNESPEKSKGFPGLGPRNSFEISEGKKAKKKVAPQEFSCGKLKRVRGLRAGKPALREGEKYENNNYFYLFNDVNSK